MKTKSTRRNPVADASCETVAALTQTPAASRVEVAAANNMKTTNTQTLETNTKHTDDLKQEVHTPDFEDQQSKAAVNENGSQKSESEEDINTDDQGLSITLKNARKLVCALKEFERLVDDQIKLAYSSLNLAADVSMMREKLQVLVAWLGNNIVFVRTPTQKDNGGNKVNAAVVAS